jgi:hypothetical protein
MRGAAVAQIEWNTIKTSVCDRIGEAVALEARVVYPTELLPDQPGRVVAHRCSLGFSCNAFDRPTCCWSGSWPGYDPFA